MSRFSTLTGVFAAAALAILPLAPVEAATASSSKKKKKSTTTTPAKKKTTEDADAAARKASGAKSDLDLPLPAKVPPKATPAPEAKKPEGSTKESGGEKAADSGAASKGGEPSPSPAKSTAEKAGGETGAAAKPERAPNATVEPEAIAEFSTQSPRMQQLIRDALDLTRMNLTYTFGSSDPDQGGMDCSGTMYYLLKAHGFSDVARDSAGQYLWARRNGAFYPVLSKNAQSEEFKQLLPGDLLFWTGTYDTAREIPVSHVMLYLGREKATGKRIMFGASDGRSYNGVQRWGVSVFDFKMPKADPANAEKAKVDFVGYARIPGLRSGTEAATVVESTPAEEKTAKSGAVEKPATTKTTEKKSTASTTKKGTGTKSKRGSN